MILITILFFMYLVIMNSLKYVEMVDDDSYIYEWLFGVSRLSYICNIVPIIPEIITLPIWLVKGIIMLFFYLKNSISDSWKDYKKDLK